MKYFFVDSNLFLQCRDVSDLPWEQISGQEPVKLFIPRAVQNEIDRLKSDGNSRRAKRAKKANSYFREILLSNNEQQLIRSIPSEVTITFSPIITPALEVNAQEIPLDSSRPDDSILIELISYRSANPDHDSALLTHDTNPLVTAKRLGLPFCPIPDDWLLSPEPDERDKELRKLQSRLEELEKSLPQVDICLLNNNSVNPKKVEATVTSYSALSSNEIQKLIDEIAQLHPMRLSFEDEKFTTRSLDIVSSSMLSFTHRYIPPSENEIENYKNIEYPTWLEKVEEKLSVLSNYLSDLHGKINISLDISNTGNMPAEHTIVRIEVSDGFAILPPITPNNDQAEDEWEIPPPPLAPHGRYEDKYSFAKVLGITHTPIDIRHFDLLRTTPKARDRNSFYFKPHKPKEPKSTWEFECEEFRHKDEPENFKFELTVIADQKINGKLKCTVMAKNLPTPTTIEIPLIISYEEGNTINEARKLCGLPD